MAWEKGQSGNASGRPRGSAGIAAYVRKQTANGHELVDALLKLARNEDANARERLGAIQALMDRGWGRPLQTAELQIQLSGGVSVQAIAALPPAQRLAYLDRHAEQLALTTGDDDDAAE